MKLKKQLKKLESMLKEDTRKQVKQRDELKALLRKLKSKEKHLVEKLQTEEDADRKHSLENEVALLHAQRKKGIKVLKGLDD